MLALSYKPALCDGDAIVGQDAATSVSRYPAEADRTAFKSELSLNFRGRA